MEEQILKILCKYYPNFANNEKVVNEILKIAEFEALCNPDIYEVTMNDHLRCQNCEELKGAIDEIKSLSSNLKEAESEIRNLNNELNYK